MRGGWLLAPLLSLAAPAAGAADAAGAALAGEALPAAALPAGPEPAPAATAAGPPGAEEEAARRVRDSRLAGAALVGAWGLLQWDYGERSFHTRGEGWFGPDTPEGGADKLGHLYTGYLLARGTAALYRRWGMAPERAALEGALSSLAVTTAMELGDGFSPYGFAPEDMVMNLAGAAAGYALARHPAWRERVDLRVEYRFNRQVHDITTDYSHARYLVAFKPAGFAALDATPLRWLELQAGYFARGYDDPLAPDRRTAFVAVGLNLPLLARAAGLERTAAVLQFWQPPDSSLRHEEPR